MRSTTSRGKGVTSSESTGTSFSCISHYPFFTLHLPTAAYRYQTGTMTTPLDDHFPDCEPEQGELDSEAESEIGAPLLEGLGLGVRGPGIVSRDDFE